MGRRLDYENRKENQNMRDVVEIIKDEILEMVFSETELDNYMNDNGFTRVEEVQAKEEKKDDEIKEAIRYTNGKYHIWVEGIRDDDNDILISQVKRVTKMTGMTKVSRFKSIEDYNNVLTYFYDKKQYHHWLCGILMAALGRRVGDTINLKWSDIYFENGKFRERLTTLIEEKTGKSLGVRLEEYARTNIVKYQESVGININEVYNGKIFSTTTGSFRTALKKAVESSGIEYEVSTHSFRKFHGFLMYELHRSDPQAMSLIQLHFGHTDINITKGYIGVIDDELDKYAKDLSDYLIACESGKKEVIENSPTITLKTEDFRNLLIEAGADSAEKLKEMIDKTEKISINYR